MAELDYAFLCDFASIENGKLTAVGASFTHVRAPELPSMHVFSVAGRIRSLQGAPPIEVRLELTSPDSAYQLDVSSTLRPGAEIRPYDGKIGLLFAASLNLPLVSAGLYEVRVYLDDELARRLAFEVESQHQAS
ncbi:MAG TPA: hypothetical protein VFC82_01755 [Actinomycetaceae bacterium]|nr:hypothetical protein [Actinomycetaceae bacterium]